MGEERVKNSVGQEIVHETQKESNGPSDILNPEISRQYFPREFPVDVKLKNEYTTTRIEHSNSGHKFIQILPGRGIQILAASHSEILLFNRKLDDSFDRQLVGEYHNGNGITAIQALPGDNFLTGDGMGKIIKWTRNIDGGYDQQLITQRRASITNLQALSDGTFVSADEFAICLWNPNLDGSFESQLVGEHEDSITAVHALSDNEYIVGDHYGKIYLWKHYPDEGVYESQLVGEMVSDVSVIRFLSNGQIVAGDCGGRIEVFTPNPDESYDQQKVYKPKYWGNVDIQVLSGDRFLTGDTDGKINLFTPNPDGSFNHRVLVEDTVPILSFQALSNDKIVLGGIGAIDILE